ncbi:hypothetical protein D3C72_1154710 [compost metagenome]
MLDDRHPRIKADALDQALATARYDDIDILRHADQRAYRLAIGGFHHLHHRGWQTSLSQAALNAGGDGAVGVNGLGAAAQDGRVAGLQAQTGRINSHIRPRLVDDPDHTQWHPHLADLNARRPVAHVADRPDRVWQAGHLTQADDHTVDTCRGQRQALEHGRFQAIGAASGQVQLVGGRQLGAGGVQGIGRGLQRTVLLCGTGAGDDAGSLTGSATQAGHIVKNGLSHGLSVLAKGKSADYNWHVAPRPAVTGGWSKTV